MLNTDRAFPKFMKDILLLRLKTRHGYYNYLFSESLRDPNKAI